jgi:TP901-1 family phage major tail protein
MMNLQLFGEAVQGRKIIYLYRAYKNGTSEAAWNLAYTTENERSMSVDADSTQTKDGSIRTPGTPEIEITATSILSTDSDKVEELEDNLCNSDLMEIWEANLLKPCYSYTLTEDQAIVTGKDYYTRTGSGTDASPYVYTKVASPSSSSLSTYYEKNTNGKFKGKYFQGYLTELTKTSNAEDFAEVQLTFGINGSGAKGDVTVSAEQQQEASYTFRDTTQVVGA